MNVAVRAIGVPAVSRGRRPRAALVLAGLAFVLLAAAAAFSFLPMRVSAIAVTGSRHFTPAEVSRLAGAAPGALLGWRESREMERRLRALPAFVSAKVGRSFDGTLAIRVMEREPEAWLPAFGCAVAGDGRLLIHLTVRDSAWASVSGVMAAAGKVLTPADIAEAVSADQRIRLVAPGSSGTWRKVPGIPGSWEWEAGGRRLAFSSPVSDSEIKRLERFQREFPREWGRSRVLDLRFADRVVIKQ